MRFLLSLLCLLTVITALENRVYATSKRSNVECRVYDPTKHCIWVYKSNPLPVAYDPKKRQKLVENPASQTTTGLVVNQPLGQSESVVSPSPTLPAVGQPASHYVRIDEFTGEPRVINIISNDSQPKSKTPNASIPQVKPVQPASPKIVDSAKPVANNVSVELAVRPQNKEVKINPPQPENVKTLEHAESKANLEPAVQPLAEKAVTGKSLQGRVEINEIIPETALKPEATPKSVSSIKEVLVDKLTPHYSWVNIASKSLQEQLADELVNFINQVSLNTTVIRMEPALQPDDQFTPLLTQKLIHKGYRVATTQAQLLNTSTIRYIVDETEGGILVRLQVNNLEASRWYVMNPEKNTLLSASAFTVRRGN